MFLSAHPDWTEVRLTKVMRMPTTPFSWLSATASDWSPPLDTVCQHTVRGTDPITLIVDKVEDLFSVGVEAALKITGTKGTAIFTRAKFHNTIKGIIPEEAEVVVFKKPDKIDADYFRDADRRLLITNTLRGIEARNIIHVCTYSAKFPSESHCKDSHMWRNVDIRTDRSKRMTLTRHGSNLTRNLGVFIFLTVLGEVRKIFSCAATQHVIMFFCFFVFVSHPNYGHY